MKKHIPNAITCCNLISGCIATTFALFGNLPMALFWIIGGAVFDFFDGMTARLLGVSSPIGKELDSLADVVTFGVAPSAMVFYELGVLDYPAQLELLRPALPYFAFIMAAFSALRLAKFNLDERQTMGFIGLPTPANALFWASLLVGSSNVIEKSQWSVLVLIVMLLVSCYLLVSEIPMFALKFKQWGWRGNEVKYLFVIISAIMLLLFRLSGFALVIAWYVVLSLFTARRPEQQ
ncbi:MAG: CDP-diacylglycerol--serine O-phosphatidyltransferase [Prevotella sp.]|nr:CDP-diacylglycerol--serine O-phosphatidyltransferase [Prevotella sp.]